MIVRECACFVCVCVWNLMPNLPPNDNTVAEAF